MYKVTSLYSSTSQPDIPVLVKYRFPKAYRHKTLDATLTKSRISHEAKCLARCLKAGVDVPSVKAVDLAAGIIVMEWIDGYGSVREVLGGLPEDEEEYAEGTAEDGSVADENEVLEEVQYRLKQLNLDEGASMKGSKRKWHSHFLVQIPSWPLSVAL